MNNGTVSKGLEDIIVAETRLSDIDGDRGKLTIGGFPLDELAPNATFEETIYLLRNDRLPDASELKKLRNEFAENRDISEDTLNVVEAAAESGSSAMDALRMGAATISLDREKENPEKDSLLAVAKFPTIVAAYWRYRNGQDPIDPDPDLSHAANYIYMMTGEEPSDAQTRGLETYLNSVVDHGLNASTFTGRVIVSSESDVISAVTGAVGSLKGPLHGGAPGPVLEMLLDIQESGDTEGYLREHLESGERIMGFGHRVYRVRDPRAAVLSNAAERFYKSGGDREFYELATDVEEKAVKLLDEYKPEHDLETNVEFYTAILLHGIGIPRELFTTTFAVARVGGWTSHCLEQLSDNRIMRPRGKYVGEKGRTWTPIDQR